MWMMYLWVRQTRRWKVLTKRTLTDLSKARTQIGTEIRERLKGLLVRCPLLRVSLVSLAVSGGLCLSEVRRPLGER